MQLSKKISFIKVSTAVIGGMLGYLLISQSYSVESLNRIVERDNRANTFQQIGVIVDKNDELRTEVEQLKANIGKFSNRASYLQAINEEIAVYKKVAGDVSVRGEGVKVVITTENDLNFVWLVDLLNESLNAGAQAMSIGGERIDGENAGFDVLPNGKVYFKNKPIQSPYELNFIGAQKELIDSLTQVGGVLSRLENISKVKVEIEPINMVVIQ